MQNNIIELKSKILDYINKNGPVLPIQISRQMNSNTIFAGAVLSELISNKKILVSRAKVGGSPVYYIQGQEYKLDMLYKYLNEKERKIYDLLKQNRILKDDKLEPWQRVAVREIKDFAMMLTTREGDIFWKWYQLSDNEAETLIISSLKLPKKQEVKETPKKQEVQTEIIEEIKEIQKPLKKPQEDLNPSLESYFLKKNIKIIDKTIIKKNKEIEFTSHIPSEIGNIKFYIKFKDKKKISDSDLSIEHNKSQLKKLPLLFLTTGELTKKAKEYIINNYLVFEKI
ncbi:MAG: hypothetical protein KJ674_03605 [Nanoarchaeota archaeon]|nr:hypothetical protein [Nanoarchaeota archaeon]